MRWSLSMILASLTWSCSVAPEQEESQLGPFESDYLTSLYEAHPTLAARQGFIVM